jgi:dihydrofolate synthase / folylpolyglutamate synthase
VNYPEAIQFLYGLRLFGAKFALENTFKLAALAGNPQEKLRFIHVAGTNGKGSTCAMLESIYRTAGLRVGLFTSPHLVSFRERIQVNRQLIPESEVVRLVEELRAADKENEATLFEFATVMALKFFADQKCDLVIWETGLGGRFDATNIVTPLASVITNIAFDHQQWLGDTLGKIAFEKAGIIKPEIPVVTAVDGPEALAVIKKIALEKSASLEIIKTNRLAGTLAPPLLGEHQKQNATLALATVEILQKQILISQKQIETGLKNVDWPGRFQLIERPNGQKILLDGAHNVAGASVLRATIEKNFPDEKKRALILGILQDKDWRHICEILAPLADEIFCVPVASERSANPNELATACRTANSSAETFVCDSLNEALEKSSAERLMVITGSLYLVGEALELLKLSPVAKNERALNEWMAGAATK